MDETQGFLYLRHSNWTICSQKSWFCSKNLPPFYPAPHNIPISFIPRERKEGSSRGNKYEYGILPKQMKHRGFCTLGVQTGPFAACEADFVSKNLHFIYPSYWEVQFIITPERERKETAGAGNGKKGFTQKWMRHRGFCTWGIQTGPFAACWADFVP